MVRDELTPYLRRRFGIHAPGCALTARFVGAGQSQLSQTLQERIALPPETVVGSQFDGSRVDFTFTLPADNGTNQAQLKALAERIGRELGTWLYATGSTSLETVVTRQLLAHKRSLAILDAEGGGHLAASFSTAEGSDRLLRASFAAPDADLLAEALRVPRAAWEACPTADAREQALVGAAIRASGATWVVVLGPKQRDERGRHQLRLSFGPADGPRTSRLLDLGDRGEIVRSTLVTRVLEEIWRALR
jgi:nicotinamide mononucleotide (NMN) deamidase PncC